MGLFKGETGEEQGEMEDFTEFAQFLQDACGISLAPNKQYLVSTRIKRILEDNDIHSLGELLSHLGKPSRANLRKQIIEAMTTNETYWFRDNYPFEYLKDALLAELIAKTHSGQELRMWSAACSTGQEPYSLSMIVEEYKQKKFGNLLVPVRILATDLSGSALAVAESGIYDSLSMARGLSAERKAKFFTSHGDTESELKQEIRDRVEFRKLNLLDNYSILGKFDIIFCRNVLIYFRGDLKENILRRFHAALKPKGILCLGSSEGLSNIPYLFEMIHCDPGIMYRAK